MLTLAGRLGADEAGVLLAKAARHGGALQRIDLAALDDIDSAGVASLRLLHREARAAGRTLALRPVSDRYRAISVAHRLDV